MQLKSGNQRRHRYGPALGLAPAALTAAPWAVACCWELCGLHTE